MFYRIIMVRHLLNYAHHDYALEPNRPKNRVLFSDVITNVPERISNSVFDFSVPMLDRKTTEFQFSPKKRERRQIYIAYVNPSNVN